MNSKKWFSIGLLLLGFTYLLLLQIKAIWVFTIDDMYISLRYARHWAEGNGLVWNIAEEPVEGYSNFSFVALAALAIHFSLDPVIVLKATGVFGLFLSTIALYWLSRLWFSLWLAFIPCLGMLVYREEILWSVSGLETTLYQALICFSLFFLLRGMGYCFYPDNRKKPKLTFFALAGFLLALAGLTRPEAPALMLLFCSLTLVDRPKIMRGDYYKGLLLCCFTFLFFFLPYFLWRWTYYGRLFPNPVYCKSFTGFYAFLDKSYLHLAWPFLLLALPAIVWAKDKRHYFLWLPSVVYLVLLINADPVSAFANRLFLPVFILLLPLAFLGLSNLWNYFLQEKNEVYDFNLLLSAFLVAFFFIPSMSLASYRFFTINPQAGIHLRQQVLSWLDKNIPSGNQVVLGDSGQIPYHSALPFIDSYCLNNKAMTAAPKKEMYRRLCKEVFAIKPQVLILTSLLDKGEVIYAPTDACLHDKLKGNKIYQFRTSYQTNCQQLSYRYEIYTLLN